MKQHHPEQQVASHNAWYVADQFKSQMATTGRRKIIQFRWQVFHKMIMNWMQIQKYNGSAPLKTLDAGCGDGINLYGLQQLALQNKWNLDLHGIDYNVVRVERATTSHQALQIKQGSLCQLPYVDEQFDIVLCNHVLEHVPELSVALQELRRVLSKNGLLIIGVPNEGCAMAQLRNRVIQRSILKATDHIHFFTAESLTVQLAQAGLDLLTLERETFFFPHSYMNMVFNEFSIGHKIMGGLRWLFPSQAGGLIAAFVLKD